MIEIPEEPSLLTGIKCPVGSDPARNINYYEDPVAGPYGITAIRHQDFDKATQLRVASVLSVRQIRGTGFPTIITRDRSETFGRWTMVPLNELLSEYPNSVSEILDDSLINLSAMIEHPSSRVEITDDNVWILYSHDQESAAYVIRQLERLGFIDVEGPETHDDTYFASISIEAEGWLKLDQLRGSGSGDRDQAFVAMWFAEEMNDYYDDGIFPAIDDLGIKCVRIDNQEHNNKICDEIIKEIKRSKLVVADFSGNRGGVYFEAGFALGLGIPVIWTVRDDHLEKVHFDTRQYNHIVYKSAAELREKLTNRISATIN